MAQPNVKLNTLTVRFHPWPAMAWRVRPRRSAGGAKGPLGAPRRALQLPRAARGARAQRAHAHHAKGHRHGAGRTLGRRQEHGRGAALKVRAKRSLRAGRLDQSMVRRPPCVHCCVGAFGSGADAGRRLPHGVLAQRGVDRAPVWGCSHVSGKHIGWHVGRPAWRFARVRPACAGSTSRSRAASTWRASRPPASRGASGPGPLRW